MQFKYTSDLPTFLNFKKSLYTKVKVYRLWITKATLQPASLMYGFPVDFKFVIFVDIFLPSWISYKGIKEGILGSSPFTKWKDYIN